MKRKGEKDKKKHEKEAERKKDGRWRESRKRGSQFCILNLADVVLWDLPPHLRICK